MFALQMILGVYLMSELKFFKALENEKVNTRRNETLSKLGNTVACAENMRPRSMSLPVTLQEQGKLTARNEMLEEFADEDLYCNF